ncbi:MAG: hypothetical protein ACRD2Z_08245 [Thermoanaerobaculia bacterium]
MRLLEERDELRRLRLEEMRKKIAEGLASLDRGEVLPGEIARIAIRLKVSVGGYRARRATAPGCPPHPRQARSRVGVIATAVPQTS